MNERVIAPSVLSLDYSNMQSQMDAMNASKAQWLHFDVMDGHFVPNITFGPVILAGFKKMTNMYLDAHLMISDPLKYAPEFIHAGANGVSFHTEALDNDIKKIEEVIHCIHGLGADAGIVVKPKTNIEQFECLLGKVEYILIMSVEPGFGGQSFMPDQLKKVEWLDAKRKELGLSYRIEIDGGINGETMQKAVAAGCDTLVAGSYVFKGDIATNVESLLR